MQAIKCELCGSNEFTKVDGLFQCNHCNTKYTLEEAKKLMVSGTVEVVTGNAEKERLIDNAEKLIELKEYHKAISEYKRITYMFPDDYRGWWGSYKIPFIMFLNNDTNDIGIISSKAHENDLMIAGETKKECFKPIYKKFQNAFNLYIDKTIFISLFKNFVSYHGLKLITEKKPKCKLEYLNIQNAKINTYDHLELNEFTKWIIYDSKEIFVQLNDSELITFQKSLVDLYLSEINNQRIPINNRFVLPDFSDKHYYDNLANFLNNNNTLINGLFSEYGFDTTISENGITIHKKNNLSIKTDNKILFVYNHLICIRHIVSSYSYNDIVCYYPCNLTKENIFKINYLCQHCGGEFKGLFKKVCSKCGKPKDY